MRPRCAASKEGEGPRNRSTSLNLDYTDKALAGGYFQAQLYWVDFEALYGGTDWGDFWGDGRDLHWFDQSQNVSEKLGGKFSWSRGDLFGLRLRVTSGLDLARDTTHQELVVSRLDWVPDELRIVVAVRAGRVVGRRQGHARAAACATSAASWKSTTSPPFRPTTVAISSRAARRPPAKCCPTSARCGKSPMR